MEAPRAVVSLSGELDVYRAASIREALGGISGEAILDFSQVTYLDSTALNELARLRKRVSGELVLVVGSPQVRRVLDLVGFGALFNIVENDG